MPNTNFIKPSIWNGEALAGEWLVTIKVDSVRELWNERRGWLSRAGRQLHHMPPWQAGAQDCELYVHSFRDTIISKRITNLKADTPRIHRSHLYGLDAIGPRLTFGTLTDPAADDIRGQLTRARALDYEGLVLRQGTRWIKVKPSDSYDMPICGFREGRRKHTGMLGFINTPFGNVGSGFSIEERRDLWTDAQAGTLIGHVVEVNCMELSAAGKFRHPTFIRMRPDKAIPSGYKSQHEKAYCEAHLATSRRKLRAHHRLRLRSRRLSTPSSRLDAPANTWSDMAQVPFMRRHHLHISL